MKLSFWRAIAVLSVAGPLWGCRPDGTDHEPTEEGRDDRPSLIKEVAPQTSVRKETDEDTLSTPDEADRRVRIRANRQTRRLQKAACRMNRKMRQDERRKAARERYRQLEAQGLLHEPVPEEPMAEGDRQLRDLIEKAAEESDHEKLAENFEAARRSLDARVRQALVDALSDYSAKDALLALTAMAGDPDADVAQSAVDQIQLKLGEVESEADRATLISSYMNALSGETTADMLAGEINALSDEKLQVETIVEVIKNGGKDAVKAARESYQFVTGEEYTTPESAEAWLRENYTPPDKE